MHDNGIMHWIKYVTPLLLLDEFNTAMEAAITARMSNIMPKRRFSLRDLRSIRSLFMSIICFMCVCSKCLVLVRHRTDGRLYIKYPLQLRVAMVCCVSVYAERVVCECFALISWLFVQYIH